KQKYTLDYDPIHIGYIKAYLSQAKLACPNTVYDAKFVGGKLPFKDDYSDLVEVSLGKFVPGNTKLDAPVSVPRPKGSESFSDFAVSSYTSSGSTGYRFAANKTLSGYDRIKITYTGQLAPGAKILSSAWVGNKSVGKQ